MSLTGSLEEISLEEVLRLIHTNRSSGTLRLSRGKLRARLAFRDGEAVAGHAPGVQRLGDLVVAAGLSDPITVQEAARIQAEEGNERLLGQILLARGAVDEASLGSLLDQQIGQSLEVLQDWSTGHFDFDPYSVPAPLEEAEEGGAASMGDGDQPRDETRPAPERSRLPASSTDVAASPDATRWLRESAFQLEVVSSDSAFITALETVLTTDRLRLRPVAWEEAGGRLSGRLRPLLLVDLRWGEVTREDLLHLHHQLPELPILAVEDRDAPIASAYTAGALAVLPPDEGAIAAAVASLMDALLAAAQLLPAGGEEAAAGTDSDTFGELVPDSPSATVALDLMQAISELAERSVLFLARGDRLTAAGAFGAGAGDRPLAQLTRTLRLPAGGEDALSAALADGCARAIRFGDAHLPEALANLLEEPASGEMAVVPVPGSLGVVALVYADNGPVERPLAELELFELATARVGAALERELIAGQAVER